VFVTTTARNKEPGVKRYRLDQASEAQTKEFEELEKKYHSASPGLFFNNQMMKRLGKPE
jgi:hypothetical protein